jgi:hypothetical protein
MFKKIIIVFLLYIIYTLLFTDFTHLREPNVEILKEQAADVKSGYNKFVDYVDDTVIPKVDTFFEENNGDKNLAGTIVESFTVEKEPFSEGLMTGKVEEETFFEDK